MPTNQHLTNKDTADKIKKFSYVDSLGNKKDNMPQIRDKKSSVDLVSIGNYMNIGYALIIPLLLGVMGGLYLDSRLNTKPMFTLGLIFAGAGISIYNLISLVKKENERRRS